MRVREQLNHLLSRWARPRRMALLVLSLVLAGFCGAQDTSRKVIARTAPSYPELARKMHLSGKVKLEVVISPAGSVTSAKLVGGNPVFESNAVEAVKQWKFDSAPVATKAVIMLEFVGQ